MKVFSAERGVEPYLSDDQQLSPFVPPLCYREPLTGIYAREILQCCYLAAMSRNSFPVLSVYSRSILGAIVNPHAERHEIAGTLIEQALRLTELLDVQSYTAFDKNDPRSPTAIKYPRRALYEAMGNALAHRDYELSDPTRITVFTDRIEILSPGSLPFGVDPAAFRAGRAAPKWRNQTLAWFFNRLQFAQAEGQGIPTILRTMREEGCPPPNMTRTTFVFFACCPRTPVTHYFVTFERSSRQ